MIHETIRSVNDIMTTLIIDRVSGSQESRLNTGDTPDLAGRLLRDAIRYIQQLEIQYEIGILRRIAHDAMDILSKRYEESDNE